jgi:glycosyltransferase involved in cell wall biosynthesis
LKIALESIAQLKTAPDFDYELLVIDNSSHGSLKKTVESLTPLFNGRLFYHTQPKRGKSFALNLGVQLAKGDILTFTDDDIIADENWLLTLNAKFNAFACHGIGGRVMPVYPKETPQWVKDNAVKLAGGVVIYDYGIMDFLFTRDHYAFIGANYAFKREVFQECGEFRTDLGPGTPVMGEDTEFVERMLQQKKILYYCGEVLIWHPVDLNRLTLRHMAKWHIALGRYAAKREMENNVKISSYFFGIPRYLYRGLVTDALTLLISVFHRMNFINAWRSFFRKIGLCQEYSLRKRFKLNNG